MNIIPISSRARPGRAWAALPETVPTDGEAYAIREQLLQLVDLIPGALRFRHACWRAAAPQARRRRRWTEGKLFSFDPAIQRAWGTRGAPEAPPVERYGRAVARRQPADAQAWEDFRALAGTILEALIVSLPGRRIARSTGGLVDGLHILAADHAAARDLADLLVVQDDTIFLVLHPATRAGFRVGVEGLETNFQLHVLLGDLLADELGAERPDPRVVAVYRGTAVPGAELVGTASFGMHAGGGLQPDGRVPEGIGGCDHWLWGASSPATIPYAEGERVILLGPPPFRMTWEVERRFPALCAGARIVERLDRATVQEWLMRLQGGTAAAA